MTHYIEPLARHEAIAGHLRVGVTVTGVSREGMDRTRSQGRDRTPFIVRTREGGREDEILARAVIDASGTYRSPNSLSSNGLGLMGMAEIADAVTSALPDVLGRDRDTFEGRRVTVVGAGHSAVNTLLALVRLAEEVPGTSVTWLIRHTQATRVIASPGDELADRARLGRRIDDAVAAGAVSLLEGFEIIRGRRGDDGSTALVGHRSGEVVTHETDVIVNATGFRPDLDMLGEVRVELDPIVEAPVRLAPLIDPNVHSCGTVEPHGYRELSHSDSGLFIVGMKSYGRAPTFLLATGYEQVRSVVAWLDHDVASAAHVQLVLPSTGVCSTDAASASACCA